MTKYFAVIEDSIVINTLVADTKQIAENVTGKVCVEYELDSDNTPYIGLSYENGIFEAPYIPPIEIEEVTEEESS